MNARAVATEPLKCDFCSWGEPPVWDYPAVDFTAEGIAPWGVQPVGRSAGSWLACGPCAALIEQREWRALAERAADSLRARGAISRRQRVAALTAALGFHRQFREHRMKEEERRPV